MSALSIDIGGIPAELRAEPRWLLWRYENREGKPTKVPYRSSAPETRASSTDPSTWGSFDAAVAAYEDGKGDGIGFALGGGFAGIDHDRCLSGTVIKPWAADIVAALDSYTEISPSGAGIKTIVRVDPTWKFRRNRLRPDGGKLEVYTHARYFAITGRVFGPATSISERTAALRALVSREFAAASPTLLSEVPADLLADAGLGTESLTAADLARPVASISDDELIARMFAAANGNEIRALFEGDKARYGNDASSADLALCCHLAFWAQRDPARMDRIFRRSKLMREKWDAQRGVETYGQRTIWRAIEGAVEIYQPSHAEEAHSFFEDATEPIQIGELS